MTRRDDAIEAAARRLDPDAWDDLRPPARMPFIAYGETRTLSEIWADRRNHARKEAAAILDAALAVLQPVIPNTAEALDDLPVGTVIRSDEGSVAERAEGYWWVTGVEAWWTTRQLTGVVITSTPTTWTVLRWGDNNDKEGQ